MNNTHLNENTLSNAAPLVATATSRLAEFGAWVLKVHRNDGEPVDVDGASIQEKAEELGLLQPRIVTEPCGEGCACSWATDFPTQCYFVPEDVLLEIKRTHRDDDPS